MEASIRRSLCARKKDRSWSRTKPEIPLLAGFRYAFESGARTIKMSLAANAKFALPLRELCETVYRHNQLVVAAWRNVPLTDQGFPPEVSTCIGVDIEKLNSQFDVIFHNGSVIEFAARAKKWW
jgi:hypothetical protein